MMQYIISHSRFSVFRLQKWLLIFHDWNFILFKLCISIFTLLLSPNPGQLTLYTWLIWGWACEAYYISEIMVSLSLCVSITALSIVPMLLHAVGKDIISLFFCHQTLTVFCSLGFCDTAAGPRGYRCVVRCWSPDTYYSKDPFQQRLYSLLD